MLQAKNLVKVYKSKTGVYVKALDNVSLSLPEKGMVFILGKSGSGKSTLLNVLGGLDSFDSGSITFNGKDTSGFKQADFDSYRNTYVGFIFQEYNLLEDFTVGANVALAMELQGEKATNERVNEILDQVELNDLGARKPNELSGGQKQRVAIARALVKNPDIIMADEPTGALDSNTGKQIFETLKKLSETKFVLVVSHDKDFAMRYADRIIELSDGKIIDDISVEKNSENGKESDLVFAENEIIIRPKYQLTSEDLEMINNYLAGKKSDVIIKANETRGSYKFTKTVEKTSEDTSEYKQIKSKLSIKNSFKIGSSGLRYKKVRLVITIILAVIAFTLFGLSDVIAAYDKNKTCYNSVIDSDVSYLSFIKEIKYNYDYGDEDMYYFDRIRMHKEDIDKIKEVYDVNVIPVYSPSTSYLTYETIFDQLGENDKKYFSLYSRSFSGFVDLNNEILEENNYRVVAGNIPTSDNDICISAYMADLFTRVKVVSNTNPGQYIKMNNYNDIVGYQLSLEVSGETHTYTICGVIDTNFDYSKYESLLEDPRDNDTAALVLQGILSEELSYATSFSLNTVCFVNSGYVDKLINEVEVGSPVKGYNIVLSKGTTYDGWYYCNLVNTMGRNNKPIHFLDEDKEVLADNEVVIPFDYLAYIYDVLSYKNDPENYNPINYTSVEHTLENIMDLVSKIKTLEPNYFDDVDIINNPFDSNTDTKEFKIVGISYGNTNQDFLVLSDKMYEKYVLEEIGYYSHAAGIMDKSKLKNIINGSFDESNEVRYSLINNVTYELSLLDGILVVLKQVFLYVGIFIGLFAALMLSNFITTSISYKRHDIGILRAIGARFSDVFKIFFSESLIISAIIFVLASLTTGILSAVINGLFRNNIHILVTIMTFSIRQIGLLLLISVAIAFIATVLPVLIHASRKPIDAIRDK